MPIDHDRLFKDVIAAFPLDFLRLFVPRFLQRHGTTRIDRLDTQLFSDLPGRERRYADLVFRLGSGDRTSADVVLLVEVQSQPQPTFPRRMFTYAARLHETYWLPLLPVALFTYPSDREEPTVYDVRVRDRRSYGLNLSFHAINLQKLEWRRYRRRRNPVAAAFMARMARKPDENVDVKLQCLRSLLRLGLDDDQAALLWSFVDAYVPLDEAETRRYNQTQEGWPVAVQREVERFMSSVERKGWERGRAEGRVEGRAEGRAEGRHQALVETVQRQLAVKFGSVPAEDQARLESLPDDQLVELSVAILTASSYAGWKERLEDLSRGTVRQP